MQAKQEENAIEKATPITDAVSNEATPPGAYPTQEQINTHVRRLMPEIKRFFADEKSQKEYMHWLQESKEAA